MVLTELLHISKETESYVVPKILIVIEVHDRPRQNLGRFDEPLVDYVPRPIPDALVHNRSAFVGLIRKCNSRRYVH